MKKLIIHSVPVLLSFMWLVVECGTFNPVILKGPKFLKFYLILVLGFYTSIFMLKLLKETISRTTFYCMSLIFALGAVKLIRGTILGKPVGFLVIILIAECVVILLLMSFHCKNKIKV
jgi:hypothetical protein